MVRNGVLSVFWGDLALQGIICVKMFMHELDIKKRALEVTSVQLQDFFNPFQHLKKFPGLIGHFHNRVIA